MDNFMLDNTIDMYIPILSPILDFLGYTLRRVLMAVPVLFLALAVIMEFGIHQTKRELQAVSPRAFEGRSPSWLPIAFYYFDVWLLDPHPGRYGRAAYQVPEIGWARTGFGTKKLAPLMWRYYSEAEIDSLNALP